MRRAFALAATAALLACGGGPRLTNLRCRADPCQDVEDPFRLLLAVDFDDPTGTLGAGELDLRVDGRTANAIALKDVFNLQNVPLGATKGTLQIDDDVALNKVCQGVQFKVSLLATPALGCTKVFSEHWKP